MSDVVPLLRFVRPYLRYALLALACLIVLVALDLAIPRLIQRIIDRGIARGDQGLVLETALEMLGISVASTVIAIANNILSVRVGEGVARDLREALFAQIQRFAFGDLDRHKTAELLVRLTSDVIAFKGLIQISLRIGTRAPLMIAGSLALMVITSPRLALMLSPLLLITALLIGVFVLRGEPLFRAVQAKLDVLNGVLQENIAGARVVKAFVRAQFEARRFERANEEMTQRAIAVLQFSSAMMPALTLCINLGIVVVVWLGGLASIHGDLSLGQVVAFTNYMLSTMGPLAMMSLLANMWASGFASAARVRQVLATVPEVQDATDASEPPADAPARITLDEVSFAYRGTGRVLRDIVLDVQPGQTVAILGATGAGKSTLVQLIPRFYDACQGQVRYGGLDVRALTQRSLLEHIAIVPQQALLFAGSVRDNIRYGKPDASDEEVVAAARVAQADEFIRRLEQGYDSHVAPRGANFSGGQKQRLCIARALLLDPDVLIFDDSTSALDVQTEAKLQDALAERRVGRTTFVVAQRISTVLNADCIVVLDQGHIVARGTHAQLMCASPVYREIYESQLGSGIVEAARASEPALS